MTLNGVMAVTLRYFTEFGKPRKESSRSLSHLLKSFLYYIPKEDDLQIRQICLRLKPLGHYGCSCLCQPKAANTDGIYLNVVFVNIGYQFL